MGIAGGGVWMLILLMNSRGGEAELFVIDLGAYGPAKGDKMLLETGSTGQTDLARFQVDLVWIPSLSPLPPPHIQLSESTKIWSSTEIKS